MLFTEDMLISILKFCVCLFMGHVHLKLKLDLFNTVQTVLVGFFIVLSLEVHLLLFNITVLHNHCIILACPFFWLLLKINNSFQYPFSLRILPILIYSDLKF